MRTKTKQEREDALGDAVVQGFLLLLLALAVAFFSKFLPTHVGWINIHIASDIVVVAILFGAGSVWKRAADDNHLRY